MKNLQKIILLSLLIIGTMSCSDDDENPWDDFSSILGEWEFVSSSTDGIPDLLDDCPFVLDFVSDYQVKGTSWYGDNCEDSDVETAAYTIEGDKLRVNEGEEILVATIKILSETTLQIEEIDEGEVFLITYKRI